MVNPSKQVRIEEYHGGSGLGEVYRASWGSPARQVALRLFPQSFADRAQDLERLKSAAKIVATLDHEAVWSVCSLVRSARGWASLAPWLPGVDLESCLSSGPVPPRVVLELGERAAAALHAAHQAQLPTGQSFCHGALRLSRLRLAQTGDLRLTGFGLRGSDPAEFCAPEGPGAPPADIFSLGVVMARLLGGRDRGPVPEARGDHAAYLRGLLEELEEGLRGRHGKRQAEALQAAVLMLESMLDFQPTRRPNAWRVGMGCHSLLNVVDGPWLEPWAPAQVPHVTAASSPGSGSLAAGDSFEILVEERFREPLPAPAEEERQDAPLVEMPASEAVRPRPSGEEEDEEADTDPGLPAAGPPPVRKEPAEPEPAEAEAASAPPAPAAPDPAPRDAAEPEPLAEKAAPRVPVKAAAPAPAKAPEPRPPAPTPRAKPDDKGGLPWIPIGLAALVLLVVGGGLYAGGVFGPREETAAVVETPDGPLAGSTASGPARPATSPAASPPSEPAASRPVQRAIPVPATAPPEEAAAASAGTESPPSEKANVAAQPAAAKKRAAPTKKKTSEKTPPAAEKSSGTGKSTSKKSSTSGSSSSAAREQAAVSEPANVREKPVREEPSGEETVGEETVGEETVGEETAREKPEKSASAAEEAASATREETAPAAAAPRATSARSSGKGVVSMKGDAKRLSLESAKGSYSIGQVPPGTYTITAWFGEEQPVPAGSFSIAAGENVTLRCDSLMMRCSKE